MSCILYFTLSWLCEHSLFLQHQTTNFFCICVCILYVVFFILYFVFVPAFIFCLLYFICCSLYLCLHLYFVFYIKYSNFPSASKHLGISPPMHWSASHKQCTVLTVIWIVRIKKRNAFPNQCYSLDSTCASFSKPDFHSLYFVTGTVAVTSTLGHTGLTPEAIARLIIWRTDENGNPDWTRYHSAVNTRHHYLQERGRSPQSSQHL